MINAFHKSLPFHPDLQSKSKFPCGLANIYSWEKEGREMEGHFAIPIWVPDKYT
jgi:hypothetical protein